MTVSITVQLTDGTAVEVGAPLRFTYDARLLTPYRSLEVSVQQAEWTSDVRRLRLKRDGTVFFDGIVDSRSYEITKQGMVCTFSCRSNGGAQMSDNQQAVYTYFNVTSSGMMSTYATPCGIAGARFPNAAAIGIFVVADKETYWDIMKNFCLQAYGKHPYVDEDNYINLTPYTGVTRSVGQGTAAPCLEITAKKHRNLVSRVYVRTGSDDFGDVYGNNYTNSKATALGIQRVQYLSPSRSWPANQQTYANWQFYQSQIDANQVEVFLPGWQPFRLGDTVRFTDPVQKGQGYYIGAMQITAASDGVKTKLTLWDPSYLILT